MKFQVIKQEQAQGKAGELLAEAKKALGKVPNILGAMAHSPVGLEYYLSSSQILKSGKLSAKEGEQIALAVAGKNGCDYCASAHSYVGKLSGLSTEEMQLNLKGESQTDRSTVLLSFVKEVMANRGHVSVELQQELRSHDISDEVLIEVVAHIALNTFTNYFNHVAGTDIDFPKVSASK